MICHESEGDLHCRVRRAMNGVAVPCKYRKARRNRTECYSISPGDASLTEYPANNMERANAAQDNDRPVMRHGNDAHCPPRAQMTSPTLVTVRARNETLQTDARLHA